jgi:hypothetical protein
MKKVLLILSIVCLLTVSFQSCKSNKPVETPAVDTVQVVDTAVVDTTAVE